MPTHHFDTATAVRSHARPNDTTYKSGHCHPDRCSAKLSFCLRPSPAIPQPDYPPTPMHEVGVDRRPMTAAANPSAVGTAASMNMFIPVERRHSVDRNKNLDEWFADSNDNVCTGSALFVDGQSPYSRVSRTAAECNQRTPLSTSMSAPIHTVTPPLLSRLIPQILDDRTQGRGTCLADRIYHR